jgi:hypothetical protein
MMSGQEFSPTGKPILHSLLKRSERREREELR